MPASLPSIFVSLRIAHDYELLTLCKLRDTESHCFHQTFEVWCLCEIS
jgi:hypothetical protein